MVYRKTQLDEETKNRITLVLLLVIIFMLSPGVIAWVLYVEAYAGEEVVANCTLAQNCYCRSQV